ncbi:hypothetical protein [Aeromonas salmonicida]|uniref:hypothetical protein n=1 Tax=Aeromonas salmonicida TaxID=645 RepID=UPI0031D4D08D
MSQFMQEIQQAETARAEWTDEQCLEFLSVAFRHCEIKGDIAMDDIRQGVQFALAVAPQSQSDIETEWDDDEAQCPTLGDYRELQRQHDELKTKLHRRGYHTLMAVADTLERDDAGGLRHQQDGKTHVSTEVLRAMASTLPEMQGGMLSDWKGSQEQKLLAINASIDRYYLALDRRQHGGIAGHGLIDEVQEIMGRNWVQGEVLNGKA